MAVLALVRLLYRVRRAGHERIPSTGGALLLPNHLSYIDAFLLSAACDRPLRFVIFDHYLTRRWIRPFLRLFGAIPISARRAKDGVRAVAEGLAAGELVCLFPEGQLSRTGFLNAIQPGFTLMARRAQAPVIPVWTDGLWGSVFTFERGRFWGKLPRALPYKVTVHFGPPLTGETATGPTVRRALQQLSADALGARETVATTLELALTHALRSRGWKTSMVEHAGRRRRLSRAVVLAAAQLLGDRWRDSIPGRKVGVLLPNSSGASLVMLGLLFAGKVPVVFSIQNPAGRNAMRERLQHHGTQTLVTAAAFRPILTDHHFPDDIRDMATELQQAFRRGLLRRTITATAGITRHRNPQHRGVSTPSPDGEAITLVRAEGASLTSHSFTHRQLLANAAQLGSVGFLHGRDVLYCPLHPTEPGGLLFGFLFPLLRGFPALMIPASLQSPARDEILRREKVSWIVTSSAGAQELGSGPPSLHMVTTTGTDPASPSSAGPAGPKPSLCDPRSGALVLAASLPDPVANTRTAQHQDGARPASQGRILPGFATSESHGSLTLTGPATAGRPVTLRAHEDRDGFVVPAPTT